MDQAAFEALMAQQAGTSAPAPEAQQQPAPTPAGSGEQEGGGFLSRLYQEVTGEHPDPELPSGSWGDAAATTASAMGKSAFEATEVPRAAAGGALKSVFETKDFMFGDTDPEEQSDFRQSVEEENTELSEGSIINGFASGIGQFATAMFGLGKVAAVAKGIGAVGSVASAVEATKIGTTVLETGKAALAGYIAVDPHADRISNFVQGTPLANPMNAWLAASPDDTETEGRMKNALESIGMDAAIIGTLTVAGKVFKTLRGGDQQAASRIIDDFQAKQQAELEQANAVEGNAIPDGYTRVEDGGTGTPEAEANGASAPSADGPGLQRGAQPLDQGATGTAPSGAGEAPSPTVAEQIAGNTVEADGRRLPKVRHSQMVNFNNEDTAAVFSKAKSDVEAIQQYGGRYQAAEAGHVFAQEDNIPYAKLQSDGDVDSFTQRLVEHKLEEMDKLRGGDILHDADVQATVMGLAKLTGEDPAKLLGRIQQSGAQMRQAAADMEVGFVVGNKMLDDAWALNERMLLGDFVEFGSKAAMQDEVTKRLTLAASFLSPARSIMSNAGRTLRRMRKDVQWLDPKYIKDADPETLSQLLRASKGNPANMRQLLNPNFWGKATDFITSLRINSLVSGYLTQFYNVVSTGYMVGARPMQRAIGATLKGDLRAVDKNLRQYVYMGNALMEGWGLAVKAFTDDGLRAGFKAAGETSVGAAVKSFGKNDSVLKPHSTEALGQNNMGTPGMGQIGPSQLRPLKSMGDLFHNIFSVAGTGLTLPGRALGATDELFKQVVYRSKLMADAHMEAVTAAAGKNLDDAGRKAFVKSYMDNRMAGAFDSNGRGLDANALREANIATFQQDLLDGTLGKTVQTAVNNWPAAKWVLPFVKTPTNVIRESWKLTPVLNLAQGEYRQMLMGKMGAEAQQQAMGQMAMGTAFMGAAAFLSSTGRITGGGPSDYKAKRELMATGWRPYSFIKLNSDGTKTYISFNRVDPIATPFGIIADVQDAIHNADWDGSEGTAAEIETAIGALRIGLAKQFTSKSYLLGLSQTMEAIMDADDNDKWLAAGGGILQSLVPYSALTRQTNDDVYMREARSVADKMMQVIPGQSEKLPAQYDWLGNPVLSRPGLWTTDKGSAVDTEVQRIAQESNKVPFQRVNPNVDGVDLRELTLKDGRNAYEVYQQLSGKPTKNSRTLETVVASMIEKPAYKKAPDGDADIKGTKAWLLAKAVSKYRSSAMKVLKRDPNIREAFMTPAQKVRDYYTNLKAAPAQQQSGSTLGNVLQTYSPDASNNGN